MQVPQDIFLVLQQTLDRSIEEEIERVGLLVYDPNTDIVTNVVSAEYLLSLGIISSSNHECGIDNRTLVNIRRFNTERIKEFYIGNQKVGGIDAELKIVPYHTHPLPDQEMFPSKEDRREIDRIYSPAVVVGSRKAKEEFRLSNPFVAGYRNLEYFNYVNRPVDNAPTWENSLGLGEKITRMPMNIVKVIGR